LDLPGSLRAHLFPRAWKLDNPAGISIHDFPLPAFLLSFVFT
jgi:hypothetical protein